MDRENRCHSTTTTKTHEFRRWPRLCLDAQILADFPRPSAPPPACSPARPRPCRPLHTAAAGRRCVQLFQWSIVTGDMDMDLVGWVDSVFVFWWGHVAFLPCPRTRSYLGLMILGPIFFAKTTLFLSARGLGSCFCHNYGAILGPPQCLACHTHSCFAFTHARVTVQ